MCSSVQKPVEQIIMVIFVERMKQNNKQITVTQYRSRERMARFTVSTVAIACHINTVK
jgi:hypothetical protein